MKDLNRLAIINIGKLASPLGKSAKSGDEQGQILELQDAWVLVHGQYIHKVGTGQISPAALEGYEVVDAKGQLLTPGLVDPHTHLVFAGWRAHELQLKLAGVPYLDILAQGGGILNTVRQTRQATEEELISQALTALSDILSQGTTTLEAKSGYGLDVENELKQLRVVRELNKVQPIDLVSTFMGAHALPLEYKEDREAYIRLVIEEMLPKISQDKLAEFCDVFCEQGVFTVEEAREILLAAQAQGLKSKIHADEIEAIGGSELAGELGAQSAEHLIAMKDSGIEAMKKGGVIACLLPATSFYLNKPYARARDLIHAGVPVALGSDFNPGSCPSHSLQFCMNLASWQYKMSPQEILTAVTLNAAAAIDRAEQVGSLEQGKLADLVIWKAQDLDFLCYRFGNNLADTVIKAGKVARKN